MALKEMYDYLPTVSADADYTLGGSSYEIHPQGVIAEAGTFKQVIHEGDDGSEERISLSDQAVFRVRLSWEVLTGSDSGILYDFYYNPSIAKGRLRSFKWKHPDDGHTYVVRFDCDLERQRKAYDIYGVLNVALKVLGRLADTP